MGLGRICHIQHPLLKYLSRNFSLCCLKLSLCVAQYSATKEIIVNRENEQTASIMLYVASHCQVIRNAQLVMFCCRHFATISGSSRIIEEQTIRSWKTCRTVLNKIFDIGIHVLLLFACWVIFHVFVVICYFFKINFFKNFFQEHYQCVKLFGSRSGLTERKS